MCLTIHRLWHQLTDNLLIYTEDKVFDEGTDLIALYDCLIKDLHTRFNPLKYALITISVSRQYTGNIKPSFYV